MPLTENKDFRFVDFKDSEITGIEVLSPDYRGVVYHYNKVRVDDSGPVPRLQFGYTLVHPGEHDIDDLNSDANFSIIMGDILSHILLAKVQDETRNNDSEKPRLF
jgi:hypothetical protein